MFIIVVSCCVVVVLLRFVVGCVVSCGFVVVSWCCSSYCYSVVLFARCHYCLLALCFLFLRHRIGMWLLLRLLCVTHICVVIVAASLRGAYMCRPCCGVFVVVLV